jgi:hypothetical protein
MRSLTIPEIIEGSYKAGYEIHWEIRYDSSLWRIVVEIDSSTIEPYWRDAAETYIVRAMEEHRPEVLVQFV